MLQVVLGLILAIPALLWDAFVITRLWGWFVVPLGVVPIHVLWAYGLLLVRAAVWQPSSIAMEYDRKRPALWHTAFGAIASAALLGVGWIVHLCM